MFILKFNCEGCDCDLLFDVIEVMICLYECIFCLNCVNDLLSNVCLNCGGGFMWCLVCLKIVCCEGVSFVY